MVKIPAHFIITTQIPLADQVALLAIAAGVVVMCACVCVRVLLRRR